VHELAVQDRSLEYLNKKWTGREEDLRPTLEKVADNLAETKKWSMKKTYWKELDVWNYDYDTQELRQKAIDNAIRQYDKQRLSSGEPEWQKLLPKEERGKGKCLSRLQANLAKGPAQPAPKIKVQKADGSPTSRDSASSPDVDRPRAGGEAMSRTSSNPLPAKKKLSGQEAQVKRLLGGKSKAAAATPKATPKPTPKASPTKPRGVVSKSKDGRILSKEIIENSDSSDDEPSVVVKARPAVPKKIKETVPAKPRPVSKPPVKKVQPTKRPRDDDDSSSSSATPLAKRIKPKQPPLPAPKPKHRPSDASQNSRGTGTTSSSLKSKNTSPTKSSPLASSPPTNASDLENDTRPVLQVAKKRKIESEGRPAVKRQAVSNVSDELVRKAERFKSAYEKYEALHFRILSLDKPEEKELGSLQKMRNRLAEMKKEIYRECPPAKA
jgi:RNA polymerase II elongation factor ELL